MSFFSKARGELSIIFDIGPKTIGAAIILEKDSEKPCVIWTYREPFVGEEPKEPRELFEAMLSTLKKINDIVQKDAMSELRMKGFSSRPELYYVLSSPWVDVEQKTITQVYDQPTIITQKVINDALDRERGSSESSGLVLVEKTITGLKLNGYHLKNPYGKKTTSLEISFTMTVSPKEILVRIEESVSAKRAHIRAFSTATYTALRELFGKKDFLSLVIEDSVTEVILARNNTLRLHTTLFSGSNALRDAVSKELGISFKEASSLVHLSFNNHIDKATMERVDAVVKKERERWWEELETSIQNTGEVISLPHIAFFVISDVGFVADMLKDQKVPESVIIHGALDPVIINSETLKNRIIFTDPSHTDVRLGLIALAIQTFSVSSGQ
ncbi:MAG TPA: hypothetical protein VMR73_02510 [Candidatus Paceibacterota bacterium]|nr:hypothetical protein [Candidatus Paceibacterota bacterium]